MYTIKALPCSGGFEDLLELRHWVFAYRTAESWARTGKYKSLKIIKHGNHPGVDRIVTSWSAETRKWTTP